MKFIGILKEQNEDPRVSVGPFVIKKIISELDATVLVEKNAGLKSGFTNEMYEAVGAQVVSREDAIEKSDILLFINHFTPPTSFSKAKTLIGILNPLFFADKLSSYLQKDVNLYSLDLMPRSSKAQAMDVLSSMASLSGYKAVIKAADLHSAVFPMFTTAAGTIKPAKVLVLGAGVAGLQAIATAKRLGAIVSAFDVRKSAGEEVKSLGAKFIEVEGAVENEKAGGYAIEQTADYIERQRQLIDKHVSEASIVISTANIPGRAAPRLIEEQSVDKMKFGSVIIDLASEQGGNCSLTEDEKIIDHNGVTIVGNSAFSREIATTASQMLSNNYVNFLKHLLSVEASGVQDDPIVIGCLVASSGEIVHERLKPLIKESIS
ncbi:MAG: NAD(P) transhydrogenase subunit alpha [Crocinitomicaceae bacterium]